MSNDYDWSYSEQKGMFEVFAVKTQSVVLCLCEDQTSAEKVVKALDQYEDPPTEEQLAEDSKILRGDLQFLFARK